MSVPTATATTRAANDALTVSSTVTADSRCNSHTGQCALSTSSFPLYLSPFLDNMRNASMGFILKFYWNQNTAEAAAVQSSLLV